MTWQVWPYLLLVRCAPQRRAPGLTERRNVSGNKESRHHVQSDTGKTCAKGLHLHVLYSTISLGTVFVKNKYGGRHGRHAADIPTTFSDSSEQLWLPWLILTEDASGLTAFRKFLG